MKNLVHLLLVFWLITAGRLEAQDHFRDSVVKIHATRRAPDMGKPWAKSSPRELSGSGVVIEGKRILTNAHVVLYAGQIFVQPHQSAEKIPATVVAASSTVDLAVLELDDDSFFDSHPALLFAEDVPSVKAPVNVYGYPTGGEQLSITEGIVSRIEFARFYGFSSGLRIQIDAALNPGNSGGPALVDDRIVGLVFSKIKQADNIGYLISVDEIRMFLEDIKDGRYEGKPMIRDQLQTAENPALRSKLKLGDRTGLVVTEPYQSADSYPLKKWDVITQIGEHSIDNQGKVRVGDDLRLSFGYFVPKLVADGAIQLKIVRDGQPMDVKLPVHAGADLVMPYLNGRYPRYFICGPVTFTQATQDVTGRIISSSKATTAALQLLHSPLIIRQYDRPAFEGEELVVLGAPLFPHRIGKGYGSATLGVVTHIDETRVRNLAHLVELVRDASGEHLVIAMAGKHETLVFNREELLAATEEILSDEGIRRQCSEDLQAVWDKKD